MKAIGSRLKWGVAASIAMVISGVAVWNVLRVKVPWPVQVEELSHIQLHGKPDQEFRVSESGVFYNVRILNGINEMQAQNFVKQKLFLITSLFQEEKSPYPGMTSNIVACPDSFLPKITQADDESSLNLRIQLAATSRNTFGVCSEEEFAQKSVFLFVFCKKSGKALRLEGFAAKDSARLWDTWLTSFKCVDQ